MSASSLRASTLAALFVVAASFGPVRAHAQQGFSEARNANIDISGARSARIEAGAGSLRVEGVPGISQVRVRGVARSSQRGRLADIRLIAERRGTEIFIKSEIPHDRGWQVFRGNFFMALDLVIEVPISLALDVDDGSGEAAFLGTGPLTLEDGSGSVEIRGTRGDVRVNDGSGEIVIDGVEGSVRLNDGSGAVRVSNVTGDVVVEDDGSGDLNIAGVGGTVRIDEDGSGRIDVSRVAGDFIVRSAGSGGITHDTVKGTISIPERKRRGT
jgi:hypothetical protein